MTNTNAQIQRYLRKEVSGVAGQASTEVVDGKMFGEVVLGEHRVFRWNMTGGPERYEVYGWIEQNYELVDGSSGWWRTDSPEEAARTASALFPVVPENP